MLEIGQLYKTGDLKIRIVEIVEVTRYFSKIEFEILHSGIFSGDTFDCDSCQFEQGIQQGNIFLIGE